MPNFSHITPSYTDLVCAAPSGPGMPNFSQITPSSTDLVCTAPNGPVCPIFCDKLLGEKPM